MDGSEAATGGKDRMQMLLRDHCKRWRVNRDRLFGAAALLFIFLMVATPRIPHTPDCHHFADMRNLIGVPNTLNVLTSFPFLVVGIVGFVFCLYGNCFSISLKGEVWGWTSFYAGFVGLAFGSAYYHLEPDDTRLIWDELPMMISVAALFSTLVIERVDERFGLTCLLSLLALMLTSVTYERTADDLRLSMMLLFIPCLAVPAVILLFPAKYSHSRYWFFAAGFYLLARFEAISDEKVYKASGYLISGHSLEHLCLAMVPILLMAMLWARNIKIERSS